jgi:hypothetical protein
MDASAKAITDLLRRNRPDAYCYPCLAGKLELAEKQIRDGAQVLILLPEFRLRQRVCAECGRQTEMLEMEA